MNESIWHAVDWYSRFLPCLQITGLYKLKEMNKWANCLAILSLFVPEGAGLPCHFVLALNPSMSYKHDKLMEGKGVGFPYQAHSGWSVVCAQLKLEEFYVLKSEDVYELCLSKLSVGDMALFQFVEQ